MYKNYSLSELNIQVKESIKTYFPSAVQVIAEISDFQENRGHAYIELVEKDNEERVVARAKATIWSNLYRLIKPYFETTTGYSISAGLKVLLTVTVEFHEVYGYSLNVRDIDPSYTIGDIAIQRAAIINRLEEEGVIGMNKELLFPLVPKRIAVISSQSAAGYGDFLNQLEQNPYGFRFETTLFESYMQGDETENSVIKSLDAIHSQLELYDVVVIIRGGGSKSELSAFDSYNIAFNICQFPLPVISGIGHERDESIVDMVSNISVKTPTAVAELLIDKFFDLFNIIEKQELRLREYIDGLISDEKLRIIEVAREFKLRSLEHIRKNKNILENITHLLNFQSVKIVNGKKQEITLYYEQIRRLTGYYIREQLPRIKIAEVQLEIIISTFFSVQRKQLEFFQLTSEYLHPDRVLERGYSMTYHNGKPIKSVKHIKEDDKVETKLIDGSFSSIVKN